MPRVSIPDIPAMARAPPIRSVTRPPALQSWLNNRGSHLSCYPVSDSPDKPAYKLTTDFHRLETQVYRQHWIKAFCSWQRGNIAELS